VVPAYTEHCTWTRSRGLGDTGYLVPLVLRDRYGWTLVDPDAAAPALDPPPSWLRLADELTEAPQARTGHEEIADLVDVVLAAGCSIGQALHVGAHAWTESGQALRDVGHNWWGWKCRQDWAEAERRAGRRAWWWRRAGHAASGDPPTCFYRGFAAPVESVRAFLAHFCPRPGTAKGARYERAGGAFWQGDGAGWFPEILAAGYRGQRTADHPGEAIRCHDRLVAEVAECWAQHRLGGLVVDGAWGPKSRAACAAFQARAGLTATGALDAPTLAALEAA
jgi:hypothetical protein